MRHVSPNVLKNRGVPIMIHVPETGPDGELLLPYRRKMTGEGDNAEPVMQEVWIQFTNAVLADIEDPEVGWPEKDGAAAGMEAWQAAMAASPWTAISKTLAICLQLWVPGVASPNGGPIPNTRLAGTLIPDGQQAELSAAVGAAFAMALGSSPDSAGKLLAQGMAQAKDLGDKIAESLAEVVDRGVDNGTLTDPPRHSEYSPAYPPGSELERASTSSGN